MTSLNPQQLAAIRITDQPLLVLAGAGSGKTRVITEKIAYLIEQGLSAKHITAVTFTNKAAREMKERVAKLLDGERTRGLRISTFHALGLDILRREYKALSFKPKLTLFDEQDKLALLRNLINHGVKNCDPENAELYARQIGQWKNAFVSPGQAQTQAYPEQPFTIELYKEYARHLKAYNAVDFDDLILLPVLLFQQSPDILEKWQNKIRYLLIDEYQDTNLTQYQLVKLLAGQLGRFTVVGDDDQSIYAWRGAQPENLVQLQKDFSRLKIIKLEQNYRSSGRILKAANQLIANNSHVFEKRLWSDLGFGEPMRVLSHKDESGEAKQIAAEIVHHKFKNGGRFKDYAILYRSNHQSRIFEQALRGNNLPYFISGGASFFSYSEIKDILSYLRLMINHDDDAAFLRIINTPRREIGPATLEKLGAYANNRHISLFAACSELGLRQILSERAMQKLTRFCRWIVDTSEKLNQDNPFDVISCFIKEIEYEEWLRENSKNDQSAERKINNVYELIDWLKKLAGEDEEQTSLDAIIAKVMLLDILDRNSEDEAGDRVSLMTLHAAKGLEFPHVFLIGFEENLLPHQNSIETGDIEEERRLAYVGITRAQKTCAFSYCTHRKRYNELVDCNPSRFLSELPEDDLEWPNKKKLDPEQQKQRGKANLAHIKSLLN